MFSSERKAACAFFVYLKNDNEGTSEEAFFT